MASAVLEKFFNIFLSMLPIMVKAILDTPFKSLALYLNILSKG